MTSMDNEQSKRFIRAINQHIADKKAILAKEAEMIEKRHAEIRARAKRSESSDLIEMRRLLKQYGYKN